MADSSKCCAAGSTTAPRSRARMPGSRLAPSWSSSAMTNVDRTFAGSIPALYDRHLGPMLFEPYALDMAERVARLAPKRVLEIAAGTGIVTRALSQKLPAVAIVATDLNQPMLDHAAARLTSERITWRQADAQALPFEDGSFDVVVCQF